MIRQVVEDYDGSLIVVTANNELYRYDGVRFLPLSVTQQLPSLFIQKVISDKKTALDCVQLRRYLVSRSRQSFSFQQKSSFSKQHFTDLYCDREGRLWTNVNRVGLFVVHGDKCENFTEKYNL